MHYARLNEFYIIRCRNQFCTFHCFPLKSICIWEFYRSKIEHFCTYFVFYNTRSCFPNMWSWTRIYIIWFSIQLCTLHTIRHANSSVFKFQKLTKNSGYLYQISCLTWWNFHDFGPHFSLNIALDFFFFFVIGPITQRL